jgi:hypothetical protein
MPGGVEEVLRLIVSVADGDRRVGGRVGFDGGDGDAHGDDNDNGNDDDNEGHGYAHDDDDADGDLVRRYVMVVSVVMNYEWSEGKLSFSLLREKSRHPSFRERSGKNKAYWRIGGIGSEHACFGQCRNNACGRTC